MFTIKLPSGTLIDPTAGLLYLEDDLTVDLLLSRLQTSKVQTSVTADTPPLYAVHEGFVTIRGQVCRFRGKQWKLLRCLSHADNFRCTRLDVMDAVYSQADQMTGLGNPEKALRDLKNTVNIKLAKHRIFIDSDQRDFWLVIQD